MTSSRSRAIVIQKDVELMQLSVYILILDGAEYADFIF